MSEGAIEAHGLVREFKKGPRAVDGIDLRVETGEVYGFLGPNGAGKCTTVHMLTTLLPPTAGSARVGGHDVEREGPAVRHDRRGAPGGRARPVPDGPRAHEAADRDARHGAEDARERSQTAARARGADGGRRPPGGRVLRRHEAPPRPGARARPPAPHPVPRRAHDRARPTEPHGAVGGGAAARGRPRRDGLPHHAVPRGGRRARGPRRHHRQRADRRRGHPRGAQGRDREAERRGDPRRSRSSSSA